MMTLTVVAWTGCDDSTEPQIQDFNRAVRRWESRGPTSYTFEYRVSCFCPLLGALEPLDVEVRDFVVTRAVSIGSGEELSEQELAEVPTIEDLFDWIADALEAEADEIDVRYDEELGYPRTAFIDRIESAIDDELSFEVSDLVPLGSD